MLTLKPTDAQNQLEATPRSERFHFATELSGIKFM